MIARRYAAFVDELARAIGQDPASIGRMAVWDPAYGEWVGLREDLENLEKGCVLHLYAPLPGEDAASYLIPRGQALKSKKPTDLLGKGVEENAEAIRLRELSTANPGLIPADQRHKLVKYRHVVTEAEVGSSTTADNAWDYICSD